MNSRFSIQALLVEMFLEEVSGEHLIFNYLILLSPIDRSDMGPKKTKKWLSPTHRFYTITCITNKQLICKSFITNPCFHSDQLRAPVAAFPVPPSHQPFLPSSHFSHLLAMAPRQSLIRGNGDEERLSQRSLAAEYHRDHHGEPATPSCFQFASSSPKRSTHKSDNGADGNTCRGWQAS